MKVIFVRKTGSDLNTGDSDSDAVLTLARAFMFLDEGDTLDIGPGAWIGESVVVPEFINSFGDLVDIMFGAGCKETIVNGCAFRFQSGPVEQQEPPECDFHPD